MPQARPRHRCDGWVVLSAQHQLEQVDGRSVTHDRGSGGGRHLAASGGSQRLVAREHVGVDPVLAEPSEAQRGPVPEAPFDPADRLEVGQEPLVGLLGGGERAEKLDAERGVDARRQPARCARTQLFELAVDGVGSVLAPPVGRVEPADDVCDGTPE